MLVLMQTADDPRWVMVLGVLILLALGGAVLYVVGYALLFAGGMVYYAFKNPVNLIKQFAVGWAVLSIAPWVMEADKVAYGWTAAIAMIWALFMAAMMGIDDTIT